MLSPVRALVLAVLVWTAALTSMVPARAQTEVDLALVLAVDISNSMDPEEQELQRQGFVEAFRSPLVHKAIGSGMLGRIAVVYLEWAGPAIQHVTVPWTEMGSPEDAFSFANRLAQAPIRRGPRTSISGAIDASMRLLRESNIEAVRRVIDVSGDGVNNLGRSVIQARDEALAQGVVINGLPLLLKRPTDAWESDNLDEYYRDCVIGGLGAFMIPVRERQQFAEAIKTKIIREIAGAAPKARVVPTQVQPERRSSCEMGVNPWAN
ncbi:hypothetical protein BB934_43245 (plasmid) [Microvirga ossetica]|uniref:VWFA domain-containing protein n=1 Tax=Microvirga ossetica TaxID=1882682 RepID=A0A1B2EYI7_9HYPH|nr:DUF1194 domain-containing protein [Microvirga ossetica]ANY85031.1 hypothetical protein BB934_43245 [Microvirga ossetica]